MVFFNDIKNEDGFKDIVSKRIMELYNNSKPINIKSYLELGDYSFVHKGFINLDSTVKCLSDSDVSYNIFEVDYFFMFAKKVYENDVNSKYDIVNLISGFIEEYFGSDRSILDKRVESLYKVAWENSFNEKDYNATVKCLNIGDFRNGNFATSVERSIMANNLLSFYGIDSYFCMGLINEEDVDYHTFNIINCGDNFVILDYTDTYVNNKGIIYPFKGVINKEEIENMLDKDLSKSFVLDNGIKRRYTVGNIRIKKRKNL